MVRVQVLQSKADALAPQPQPDRKWEVGSGWTMLVKKNPSPSKSPIFTWFSCWKSIHLAAYGLECSNRGLLGGCRCEGLGMLWLMTMVYVGHFFNIPLMWPKVSIINYKYILYIWHKLMTYNDNEYNPLDSTHSHERLVGPRHSQRSTTTWLATATINLLLGQSTISNFTNTEKTIENMGRRCWITCALQYAIQLSTSFQMIKRGFRYWLDDNPCDNPICHLSNLRCHNSASWPFFF